MGEGGASTYQNSCERGCGAGCGNRSVMGAASNAADSTRRYSDGMSLYQYGQCDPVNRIDGDGTISEACCNNMLAQAMKDPGVQAIYGKAKTSKDGLGIPCLGVAKCKKSCIGGPSGRYNPFTRNVSMCADQLSNNQGDFNQILVHELTHAESVCGWWKLGCKNCMTEEKRAYYKAGECFNDVDCTNMAWGSCTMSVSCSDIFDKPSNYVGVGWPPRP